jgi:hypothetical protein
MEIIGICISAISILVAVGIACWTSRSSAKDTARQIAAIEESTSRQIESLKDLEKLQIEITSMTLERELWNSRQAIQQASKKFFDDANDHFSLMGMPYNEAVSKMYDRNEKKRDLNYQQEYYDKQAKFLKTSLQRLEKIKKDLAIN